MNIGKHGIYANIGIPGSGVSYNKKLVSFPKKDGAADGEERKISAEQIANVASKAYMMACLIGGIAKGIAVTQPNAKTDAIENTAPKQQNEDTEIIEIIPVSVESLEAGRKSKTFEKVSKTS